MHRYCYIVVINLPDFRVSDPVPVETIQKIIIIKKQVAFKADGYSFGELFLCL